MGSFDLHYSGTKQICFSCKRRDFHPSLHFYILVPRMKKIRFLLVLGLNSALVIALNTRIGILPPIGKFLDPFAGFWQNSEGQSSPYEEIVTVPGLEKSARVFYDERRVPHIFAESETDLYFLQGYITARERLFQMQLQAFAASGRLSEMFGEIAFETDRLARRRGMAWAAERSVAALNSNEKMMGIIQAYSNGVNAWLENMSIRQIPLEFKMLDLKPESWSPLKTLALLKYMSNMLTGKSWDFGFTNSLAILGPDEFKRLFPRQPDSQDVIVPPPYDTVETLTTIDTPEFFQPVTGVGALIQPEIDASLGSNNWAVSGTKTKSGKPILCNDPHLALNLPSIWFEMQLHGPGINVYGVALCGAPGIITGFNQNIAWGVTNASRDVQDWYRIEFRDSSMSEYEFDGKWVKTEMRTETILVRGGQAVMDTVLYTLHGPVVYDSRFSDPGKPINLAMRWTAHDESNESMTFYGLNRAKNHDDYREAISHFLSPGQNFVFASSNGDIAITHQGRFPVRWPWQGWFIMDGSDPKHLWQGWIPNDDNPHILNPERGFVSSANQAPVTITYSYDVSGWYENFRNRRINEQLNGATGITPEDMMQLQNDNFSWTASMTAPLLLSNLDTGNIPEKGMKYYDAMRQWNYYFEPERIAPSLFELWSKETYRRIWADDLPDGEWPSVHHTLELLKSDSTFKYSDDKSTPGNVETFSDLVNASFQYAVDSLERMSVQSYDGVHWTDLKGTFLQHLMRVEPFNRRNIRNGGGANIVNATGQRNGPSWRMIVELGDVPRAWGIIPGGQSGNPGSPFYDNQVSTWVAGEYYELIYLISPDALPAGKWEKQILEPGE